jgi:hypothetical protein
VAEDLRALAALPAREVRHVLDDPRIGTSTLRNIVTPFTASMSETSCGVVTMTAPSSLIAWESVSWASPVPGGRSTTRKSRSPQTTSPMSCVRAFITIGPRHTSAASFRGRSRWT